MTSETPGWYYAELDPEGTKRYWNGTEWSSDVVGGNTIWPRFGARLIDGVINGIALFIIWWAVFDSNNANIVTSTNTYDEIHLYFDYQSNSLF